MANKRNGTLYTGVTSDLAGRVWQHRQGVPAGSFTSKYGCKMLIYYELADEMRSAIAREKKIKAGSRDDKIAAIMRLNPEWRDLWNDIIG